MRIPLLRVARHVSVGRDTQRQLKSGCPYLKMELIGSRNISSLAAMVRLQGDCENETFIADRRRRLRIRGVTDAIRLGDAPRNSR